MDEFMWLTLLIIHGVGVLCSFMPFFYISGKHKWYVDGMASRFTEEKDNAQFCRVAITIVEAIVWEISVIFMITFLIARSFDKKIIEKQRTKHLGWYQSQTKIEQEKDNIRCYKCGAIIKNSFVHCSMCGALQALDSEELKNTGNGTKKEVSGIPESFKFKRVSSGRYGSR